MNERKQEREKAKYVRRERMNEDNAEKQKGLLFIFYINSKSFSSQLFPVFIRKLNEESKKDRRK
jgi:hypothetical protein